MRRFDHAPPMTDGSRPRVEIESAPDADRIDVRVDGLPFTHYVYREDIPDLTKPVLYPIRTAKGAEITRGYPLDPRPEDRRDHPHHVGLWFTYGNVDGIDFWNLSSRVPAERRDEYGTIHHRAVERTTSGFGRGELAVSMDWVGPDGRTVLEQETTFVVFATSDERAIDHVTTLRAGDRPVRLHDDKEGLLCVRLRRELEHPAEETVAGPAEEADADVEPTGVFLSSEGDRGTDVWGTRARWVRLTGRIGGEPVTVAMFDHPENVGYPTHWVARGYGPFGPNPIAPSVFSGDPPMNFELAADEATTFRYRIAIKTGDIDAAELDDRQAAFAEGSPPDHS